MDQPYYRRINSDIADDLESICYRLVINSLLNGEFGNGQDVHGSSDTWPDRKLPTDKTSANTGGKVALHHLKKRQDHVLRCTP